MNHVGSLETNIWVYFLLYIIFIPSTFPGARLRTCRAYTSALGVQLSSQFSYLRPWLLSQKLSIGRFITSSN